MTLTERLSHYEKLMRLDKPIGILLLLWPTLWGQWLASHGHPDWLILWIFVMGVVLMRSAGCVINDYADRDFDPHVARTRERPLAAGKVSPKEALLLAAGLSVLAFLLILPLNNLVHRAVCGRAVSGRQLPVHQAIFCHSAGLSRHRVRFWHSDELRRAVGRHSAGSLGPAGWPTPSGPLPTIRNTPWSTAKTTSRSASRPRPSPSADMT